MKGKIDKARGGRIREARTQSGKGTQEALGALLDPKVERAAVSAWEQGKGITQDNLSQIARITGYAYEWLATGRGPKIMDSSHAVNESVTGGPPDSPDASNYVGVPGSMGPRAKWVLKRLLRLPAAEGEAVVDEYLDRIQEQPPANPPSRARTS